LNQLFRLYRDAFSGIPRDLWLIGTAAFLNRCGTMVLPFLSLYLTAERGLSTAQAGQLVGIYGFGAAFGAYAGGWLSDRIGSLRTQQLSLGLGGMGFLILGSLERISAIAIGLFFVSLIVESLRPAVMTTFAERTDDELRPKAFAFLRLAANLGMGIAPAAGGALALYGFRWLFIVDAITCWVALGLLFRVGNGRASSHDEGGGSGTRAKADSTRPLSPWRDVPFLLLFVLSTLLAAALFQIFSTVPLYLRQSLGFRENVIGGLLSLNAFLIVAFEMVLIHLVRHRDRMHIVGIGSFLLCLGLGLMPYGVSLPYLALTVVVWTFGEMLVLPILNVVVAERAGHGVRGQYMGLYMLAFSIAFIIAPVLGTYALERYGASALWQGVGLLGVVLWGAALLLRPHLRRERD
jgi:MFS family permease